MSYIDKGKQAEYIFAAELLGLGLTPCWPSVESQPYDLICAGPGHTSRIQVKGTTQNESSITVRLKMQENGKNRTYTKLDVDYIAVYLYQYLDWYIIPIDSISKTSLSIRPGSDKCSWQKYKNAWHLLK